MGNCEVKEKSQGIRTNNKNCHTLISRELYTINEIKKMQLSESFIKEHFNIININKNEWLYFDDYNIPSFKKIYMDDDIIKDRVVRKLFDIKPEVNLRDEDAISSRKFNQLSKFYVDLNGEIQQKGDNLWGLFSGVTKFTTHSIKGGNSTENKIFGTFGNREREIFKDLVELV